MAGSYHHIAGDTDDDGARGWSLIENMGDAYEAVEQLLWLVEAKIGRDLARRFIDAEFYPMCRSERAEDAAFVAVREMMNR